MLASPRQFGVWIALTAILMLMGAYVIVASRLPFGGYSVVSYSSVPPKVCPGALLRLDARINIDLPWHTRLGRYQLETYWLNERGGRTNVETFIGSLADAKEGERTVESPVLRQAPGDQGHWYLVSVMTYSGTVLGYPRATNYGKTTETTVLETLDKDDPRCSTPSPS